ncbi:MAG: AAA family ATPase [Clostridiales bacterium]|nr:AAA family ATPase [Clostridiales bacterium]
MKCYNCGFTTNEVNRECPNCQLKFPIECTSCNAFNLQYSIYCANCGNSLVFDNSTLKNFGELTESRKNVAVIFADISGFTALSEKLDPEEVRNIVNGCFDYITKPVYELDGTIDKYIGDCVMILFGAKHSHADDASRAVRCALKMQDLVKEYSRERILDKDIELKLSIGVNYGLVVTGRVGNTYDSDFTVMGDTVNTAQRLQSSAGKENILVSEACYYETNDVVRYSDEKEIFVKNKEKPLKCFNAIDLLSDKTDSIILIDRKRELEFLNRVYDSDMKNRFVWLTGASGIGKTYLIDYFCESVGKQNIRVNCSNIRNKSYDVISLLLFNITKIKEVESMSNKKKQLRTAINYTLNNIEKNEAEKCYDYLTLIMELEKSDDFNKTLNSMAYADIVREIDIQVLKFFDAFYAIQDLIVVFDNLQWADESSLRILSKIIEHCKIPSFFYILSSYSQMNVDENVCELNKFDSSSVEEMIKVELECSTVDEKLIVQITDFSDGNPLYIKEYLNNIRRYKKYDVCDGVLNVDDDFIRTTPNSIENIILNNLSELDNLENQFLSIAACIGKEFNVNWVLKILNRSFDYEKTVSKLMGLNVIALNDVYTTDGVLNKSYVFNQETVKDVIFKSVLNRTKEEYSEKIGRMIEREYSHEKESYYEVLHRYYRVAGNKDKEVEYVYLSARKNRTDYKLDSALKFYKLFLDIYDYNEAVKNRNLVNCYIDMGSIYTTLGQSDIAIGYLNKGLEVSELSDEIYSIQLMIVEIYKDTGRYDEALEIIEEIEVKIRENSNLYGKLLLFKCNILYYKRDKSLLELAKISEEILIKTRDFDSLSQLESIVWIYHFTTGNTDDGLYYLNKAYEHAQKSDNLKLLNKIGSNLGISYHQAGQVSKAMDYFTRALETSERISDMKTNISVSINLGLLYLEKGRFESSKVLLERAEIQSKEISLVYQHCNALINLGCVLYEKGLFDQAIETFSKALEVSKNHEMKAEEGIVYSELAKVKIKQNQIDDAVIKIDLSYKILNEINDVFGLIDVFVNRARIEIVKGHYDLAIEHCNKALDYAVESDDDFKRTTVLRVKGRAFSLLEQTEDALTCYNESIKLSLQLESEYQSVAGYYERSQLYKQLKQEELGIIDINKMNILLEKIDDCTLKSEIFKKNV